MQTEYLNFYYLFKNALATKELNPNLIYKDEVISWFKDHYFDDLAAQASISLQTRSYPYEIEEFVKTTLSYLYDDSVERVDASVKHIPSFLLKDNNV